MKRAVVVGASAGGVAALEQLVSGLPAGFEPPVLIVLHLPVGYESMLARILSRAGPLPAQDAADGEALEAGRIYVAVPDHHLMVDAQRVRVVKGPRENNFRPSVDVLFRSAAYAWGSRAIGVVLSGALNDGASGLWAIKTMGGIAIVQDPADAAFESMPAQALRRTDADHMLRAQEMGPLLARLADEPPGPEPDHAEGLRRDLRTELEIAAGASAFELGILQRKPSSYTCPACGGVLFEIPEGGHRRFRCHTGHGFSVGALLPELMQSTEAGLWNAVRSVEEAIALCREAAAELQEAGQHGDAQALLARAERAGEKLALLRSVSLEEGGLEKPG